MLPQLEEFRSCLDTVMLKCMHKRVVLYGYGYSGQFVKWYAKYYHGIIIDYIVSMDMTSSIPYDLEIFRPSLFDFGFRDVADAVIWVTEPISKSEKEKICGYGYIENRSYYDLHQLLYPNDKSKSIQFLAFLEDRYGCDFLAKKDAADFIKNNQQSHSYRVTTQKEIFSILDRCHCKPQEYDAIFDYGCGKGGALVSFLDYGFYRCGGVEYQPDIYKVLIENRNRLKISDMQMDCYEGDAIEIRDIDSYNWFYFFDPFGNEVMDACAKNIRASMRRRKRKVTIIIINPHSYLFFLKQGFILTNQFTVEMRQRVVGVFSNV